MMVRDAPESDDMRAELVDTVFRAAVPLVIMISTFASVGAFVAVTTGDTVATAMAALGTLIGIGKIALHLGYRRIARSAHTPRDVRRWERRFAAANIGFAAAVGLLSARAFLLDDGGAQLLATGIVFGFCAGQVARVAVRPRICVASVLAATAPGIVALSVGGSAAHLGLAGLFALFAAGGLETIRYAYRQTRDRIVTNRDLASIARIDALTGLENRLGLRLAVQGHFDAAVGRGRPVAVHCLDLNGFKALNDRHGHATGDAMLVAVARRIGAALREGDIAARFGGDEFVVIQGSLGHVDEAALFARRLRREIARPVVVGSATLSVRTSIGSCTGDAGVDAFDDLLALADRRMYRAKQADAGLPVRAAMPSQPC